MGVMDSLIMVLKPSAVESGVIVGVLFGLGLFAGFLPDFLETTPLVVAGNAIFVYLWVFIAVLIKNAFLNNFVKRFGK